MAQRPLWTCPDCGRRFVTANLWHSCYVGSVDDFFVNHAELRPLFDAYVRFVQTIGPFTVEVVKTRISFVTRARFAGVVRLRRDALVAGFWLKRAVSSERFTKVEHIERQDWVYQLLLRSEARLRRRATRLAERGLRGRATTHVGVPSAGDCAGRWSDVRVLTSGAEPPGLARARNSCTTNRRSRTESSTGRCDPVTCPSPTRVQDGTG